MDKISLNEANIENLTSLWKLMGARSLHDFWMSDHWPNRCWFNPCSDSELNKRISQSISQINDRYLVPIFLHANDQSIKIEKLLVSNNFKLAVEQVAMVMDIKDYAGEVSTLDLFRVSSNEEVSIWTDIVSQSFEYHIDLPVIEKIAANPDIHILLARIKGRPVAAALLYVTGDIVGVHQLGVLIEHRGKGIAHKLMQNIINKCQELSAHCITLQASIAAESLYTKFGFKRQFSIPSYQRKNIQN